MRFSRLGPVASRRSCVACLLSLWTSNYERHYSGFLAKARIRIRVEGWNILSPDWWVQNPLICYFFWSVEHWLSWERTLGAPMAAEMGMAERNHLLCGISRSHPPSILSRVKPSGQSWSIKILRILMLIRVGIFFISDPIKWIKPKFRIVLAAELPRW
jgi:hypothetical protein